MSHFISSLPLQTCLSFPDQTFYKIDQLPSKNLYLSMQNPKEQIGLQGFLEKTFPIDLEASWQDRIIGKIELKKDPYDPHVFLIEPLFIEKVPIATQAKLLSSTVYFFIRLQELRTTFSINPCLSAIDNAKILIEESISSLKALYETIFAKKELDYPGDATIEIMQTPTSPTLINQNLPKKNHFFIHWPLYQDSISFQKGFSLKKIVTPYENFSIKTERFRIDFSSNEKECSLEIDLFSKNLFLTSHVLPNDKRLQELVQKKAENPESAHQIEKMLNFSWDSKDPYSDLALFDREGHWIGCVGMKPFYELPCYLFLGFLLEKKLEEETMILLFEAISSYLKELCRSGSYFESTTEEKMRVKTIVYLLDPEEKALFTQNLFKNSYLQPQKDLDSEYPSIQWDLEPQVLGSLSPK